MAAKKSAAAAAPKQPAKAPAAKKSAAETSVAFDWAQNPNKLLRAKAHVAEHHKHLKVGTPEHEAAVKDRYVEIKGALAASAAPAPKKGTVVNLADDDGSEDIENDTTDAE